MVKQPDLLILHWDERRIVAVQSHRTPRGACVNASAAIEWPGEIDPRENPGKAGDWLREWLDSQSMTAARAVVVLPREAATLNYLHLPAASDEELPCLVRFQAAARASLPMEELCLDFVPLPSSNDRPGREVLAATVRQELVARYRHTAQAAGLDVLSFALAPVAVAELVSHAAKRRGHSSGLAVSIWESHVRVDRITRGHLVFSHVQQLPAGNSPQRSQYLLASIRRLLASQADSADAEPMSRAWLFAEPDEAKTLAPLLQDELGCPVDCTDPFDHVETSAGFQFPANRSTFAVPLGALLSRDDPAHPAIDFLHPRLPAVKKDRRLVKLALAVSLVVVVAGSFWLYIRQCGQDLDQRIARYAKEEKELKRLLEKGKPVKDAAKEVEAWTRGRTVWLDELLALQGKMPESKRTYVESIEFDAPRGVTPARIEMSGYARERKDVMSLNQRMLQARDRYELQPHGIHPSKRDKHYPWRFQLEAYLSPSLSTSADASSTDK